MILLIMGLKSLFILPGILSSLTFKCVGVCGSGFFLFVCVWGCFSFRCHLTGSPLSFLFFFSVDLLVMM